MIDEIDVDISHQRLLAASLEKGQVVVCDPKTGRINSDIISFSPDGESLQASCIKLSR